MSRQGLEGLGAQGGEVLQISGLAPVDGQPAADLVAVQRPAESNTKHVQLQGRRQPLPDWICSTVGMTSCEVSSRNAQQRLGRSGVLKAQRRENSQSFEPGHSVHVAPLAWQPSREGVLTEIPARRTCQFFVTPNVSVLRQAKTRYTADA